MPDFFPLLTCHLDNGSSPVSIVDPQRHHVREINIKQVNKQAQKKYFKAITNMLEGLKLGQVIWCKVRRVQPSEQKVLPPRPGELARGWLSVASVPLPPAPRGVSRHCQASCNFPERRVSYVDPNKVLLNSSQCSERISHMICNTFWKCL